TNHPYLNGPCYYDPLQQLPYVPNPESVYWESIHPVSDQMYQNWNHWEPYPMSVHYPMPVLTPMFPVHEGNSAPRDPSSAQAPQHQRPNPQQPQEIARIHSKAVEYCENCPVYWDDKIVNLFRYLFDPSNPSIHQTVKVYHPKNGRSIFKEWVAVAKPRGVLQGKCFQTKCTLATWMPKSWKTIRSKPKVTIAKLMGPIRPQPPTKQPYVSSLSPEPLFRPIAPRGPEASKPVGPPTPPPLQIPALKLSDPEKLQQAIEYCNNCALYKDEKLINRSQFLFDPTKSELYQQVIKSRNSTGKNFFVAWMDREKKGTFKYTDWKNVPEDGPLKREWKQRALALEEVQEEQQRNGFSIYLTEIEIIEFELRKPLKLLLSLPLKVRGHEKNNVLEIPFKDASRGVELVRAMIEGAASLPTEPRGQRESARPIAYMKARTTDVRRVTLSVVHRDASECSAGPQSLVQIIMSNQNMPTNPNMITATLVSPLALINIAKSNSQYLNEVLPMNPVLQNAMFPETSHLGFGTHSLPDIFLPISLPISPSNSEPFFFYCDDVELYRDPLTTHSRGCLFNPVTPQYVGFPPGKNETMYFQWFMGEKKGNLRDADDRISKNESALNNGNNRAMLAIMTGCYQDCSCPARGPLMAGTWHTCLLCRQWPDRGPPMTNPKRQVERRHI
ncbi:Protein CBG07826, partial [Caenorhabditis briggsae]